MWRNFQIGSKRPGDVMAVFANAQKIQEKLKWEPEFSLDDMMAHAWNWQKNQD